MQKYAALAEWWLCVERILRFAAIFNPDRCQQTMHNRFRFFATGILLLLLSAQAVAQKQYTIHLSFDKIYLDGDSVVFRAPKILTLRTAARTDTLEVAKLRNTPLAFVADVRKVMRGKQSVTQIGYAFFKKVNGRWQLIRHFGYTDRYSLLAPPPGFAQKSAKLKPREEYHCEYGVPVQFAAWFRMDVYWS
ncbi:MAG: hypothetical protein IM638_08880 [Bacteroidetes bacterium]|nr:hypothetical protein [Bacteroidota bacterium]